MDRTSDDLEKEIQSLKQAVIDQGVLLNKIILMIHLSNSDLKNHLDILDT